MNTKHKSQLEPITTYSVLTDDGLEPQPLLCNGSESDVVEILQNYEPSTVSVQEWSGEDLLHKTNGAEWLVGRPCPLCGNTLESAVATPQKNNKHGDRQTYGNRSI